MKKNYKAIIAVLLVYSLPLVGISELIIHWKIILLGSAFYILLITQPDIDGEDLTDKKESDHNSVLYILFAGLLSQIIPVIEWGYFRNQTVNNNILVGFGLVLIVSGLLFRIWAIRTLKEFFTATVQIKSNHQLIQEGPYAIVRHPSYLGAFTSLVGSTVFLGTPIGFIFGIIVLNIAYKKRLKVEEAILIKNFGSEYEVYKITTPAVVPNLLKFKNYNGGVLTSLLITIVLLTQILYWSIPYLCSQIGIDWGSWFSAYHHSIMLKII